MKIVLRALKNKPLYSSSDDCGVIGVGRAPAGNGNCDMLMIILNAVKYCVLMRFTFRSSGLLELRALAGIVEVADDLVDGVESLPHHLVNQLGRPTSAVFVHLLDDAFFGAVDGTKK